MSTILVADDEIELSGMIADALAERGYKVIQASDGLRALKVLEETAAVELLLSDVRMPHMNGYELAEAALARDSELKILMLTGYAAELPPLPLLGAREIRV